MYKNPRGHAVKLLNILVEDSRLESPRWNATREERDMLKSIIDRHDAFEERQEAECAARELADFHKRAYGHDGAY
jgi:hypothetical protein